MRRQLTLAAAAIASLIVLAFLIPLALLIRTLAADRALASADQSASVLVPVLATVEDRSALRQVVDGLNTGDPSNVTVFFGDGDVIGAPAPDDEATTDVQRARQGRAFTMEENGGTAVYLPVVKPNEVDVIRSWVPDSLLRRGVSTAWLVLGALGVALVAVATIVADRLARSIVQPVNDLARTAEALSDGDLEARVAVSGPPEIVEVGMTLNQLAGRIEELLTAEREAVADLSHRLRTPVTALKLDAESVSDPTERERLATDIAALQRAVDRLITEARRPVRQGVGSGSDLVAVTRERVGFWAALAEDQGRTWRLDLPDGEVTVPVPHDDLEAALDALLGNVLAHTPDGVPFRVAVLPNGTLVVDDEGPGFPDDDVLARGQSGGGSTGLGLDIVRQTAEVAGGRLSLGSSPAGGGRVTVTFQPSPAIGM